MVKYEIVKDEKIKHKGKTLYKIRALKDFDDVKKGDLGGYIEDYNNLSQGSNCWIYNNAKVYDNARVYGNAEIYGNARVYGYSEVFGYSKIYGNARVYDNSKVFDNAEVYGSAEIYGKAETYDNAEIYGDARVYGKARVSRDAIIGKVNCEFDKIIEIQNPKGRLVTGILKDNKIYYSVGCQTNITEEEFRWRIKNTDGGLEKNLHRVEYYKIIDMIKLYFGK